MQEEFNSSSVRTGGAPPFGGAPPLFDLLTSQMTITRTYGTVAALAAFLDACYQMSANAMRLSCVNRSGRFTALDFYTAPLKRFACRFFIRVSCVGANAIALFAVTSAALANSSKFVAFGTKRFTGVLRRRGIAAQCINSLRDLLNVFRVNAASYIAFVIALKRRVKNTAVQHEAVNVRLQCNSLEVVAPISISADIAGPDPTWPKFWVSFRDRAVFVNPIPEILFRGALASVCAVRYVATHCLSLTTTQHFVKTVFMLDGFYTNDCPVTLTKGLYV